MTINSSTSTAVFWWRPAAWLGVGGEDASDFLQGQFTNDLRGLGVGAGAVYGLWLDVKGKVLADSFVMRKRGESGGAEEPWFWIGSYSSAAAVILTRLENYIVAEDVFLEDVTTGWRGVSLLGPDAKSISAEKCHALRDTFSGAVFQGRRGWEESVEWVFPVEAEQEVRRTLAGLAELDAGEMERRRIAAGIPAVPADIGPGDLPNEGGLERDAISYVKGCYLGQEVMARLKSMGRVRRRLVRVKGTIGELPGLPAPLFSGERQVGELRSAVRTEAGGFAGLALLSLLHVTPTARLAMKAGAEPVVQLEETP